MAIGQMVQGAVQAHEQHGESRGERGDLPPRRPEPSPRHIEPAQQGEPDEDARMEVPAPPGVCHHFFNTNAPNRNMSPIVMTSARSSGPPNRNVKKRLSILRCM